MTGFRSDGLSQELTNLSSIEMVDEAPNTRLAEAGQALHEVEPLADGIVWVIIVALLGGPFAKHIREQGCMIGFLICHEFDQGLVFRTKASREQIVLRESCKAIVEKVQFDPLLVQAYRFNVSIFSTIPSCLNVPKAIDSKSKSLLTMYLGRVPLVPNPPAGVYGAGKGFNGTPAEL